MVCKFNLLQVIEYTGELVRPSIADRRERLIYNSLVVCKSISIGELIFVFYFFDSCVPVFQ